jgi:hypothetical protein
VQPRHTQEQGGGQAADKASGKRSEGKMMVYSSTFRTEISLLGPSR